MRMGCHTLLMQRQRHVALRCRFALCREEEMICDPSASSAAPNIELNPPPRRRLLLAFVPVKSTGVCVDACEGHAPEDKEAAAPLAFFPVTRAFDVLGPAAAPRAAASSARGGGEGVDAHEDWRSGTESTARDERVAKSRNQKPTMDTMAVDRRRPVYVLQCSLVSPMRRPMSAEKPISMRRRARRAGHVLGCGLARDVQLRAPPPWDGQLRSGVPDLSPGTHERKPVDGSAAWKGHRGRRQHHADGSADREDAARHSIVGTTYELGSETTALEYNNKIIEVSGELSGEATAVILQGEWLQYRTLRMTFQGVEE
ncbi:hypothetical protein ABZP36_030687 [Zizania latifolia]